uniref:Uncharacterized protein n=1 Tax=Trichobilharzia regenti TaxID=157069 RepID=A0AA85KME0_TRIRE|nr:unnamed protein product [Trichobilharzia regenti]
MGPHVTRILSYINPQNILIAQGSGHNNILISNDYGKKWNSTNFRTQGNLIKNSISQINATLISWTMTAGKFDQNITGNSCQLFQQGSFKSRIFKPAARVNRAVTVHHLKLL